MLWALIYVQPFLDIAIKINCFTFGQRYDGFLIRLLCTLEQTGLRPALFNFRSTDQRIHIRNLNVVHFFYRFLDLNFVGIASNNKTVTVQLLAGIIAIILPPYAFKVASIAAAEASVRTTTFEFMIV